MIVEASDSVRRLDAHGNGHQGGDDGDEVDIKKMEVEDTSADYDLNLTESTEMGIDDEFIAEAAVVGVDDYDDSGDEE